MTIIDEAVATDDIATAESVVRAVYPHADLHESRQRFLFSQQVRGDERVNFARFKFSSWMDIRVDFEGVVGVGHLMSGAYQAEVNGDGTDPARPFVLRPGQGRSRSEQLDLLMVNLSEGALARFAAAAVGADAVALRFPGTAAITEAHEAHWQRSVAYVRTVVADDELFLNPLIRGAAFDTLLAGFLASFPVEVLGHRPVGEAVLPATVRRAVHFIEENAHRPIGLEEIAAASRMSVRGLQGAFRRYLDTTPSAYLRRVRLDGARVDLADGDPAAGASVAGIARRWGFSNLGRFAAEYRAAYGEAPGFTLRT